MTQTLILLLAFTAANLPWFSNQLFYVVPLKHPEKNLAWCLFELVLLYLVVGAIVFIETGILFGFFLPGDSILFSAGLVAAAHDDVNIVILVSVIFIAAFFGDQIGFVLGRAPPP